MEQVVQFVSTYKPLVVGVAMIIIALIIYSIFKSMTKAASRAINRTIRRATRAFDPTLYTNAAEIVDALKSASEEVQAKSVAGATNLYLPKITKDFADFHNNEALAAIKIFINEYLDIKYGEKEKFDTSNVEPGLEETINRYELKDNVSNVVIHKTVITGYEKTNEYATITYQTALGYNLRTHRVEERVRIEYTMKLSENGVADKALKCDVCGASIDSAGIEVCPYCDSRIIRDTRMSWKFTLIEKI